MDLTDKLKKGNLDVTLKKGETVRFDWFLEGENIFEGEINFYLQENCSLEIVGRYNLKGDSNIKQKITIHHQKPNSKSKVELKSVLDNESNLSIIGKIKAYQNSSKTDASLLHKTILLSNSARVKTEPQLIIEHDDVKCNHGATIGNLDENSLFYLQSRGISKSQAKRLLIDSFLDVV